MLEWIKKKLGNKEGKDVEQEKKDSADIKVDENEEGTSKDLISKTEINEIDTEEEVIEQEEILKNSDEDGILRHEKVGVQGKEDITSLEEKKPNIPDKVKEEKKEQEIVMEEESTSLFQRLKKGLSKTRDTMGEKINDILGSYVKIDEEMLEDLEDLLISADMGMETTMELIDALRNRIRQDKIQDPSLVKGLLSEEINRVLLEKSGDSTLDIEPGPAVILIVGVNGVGKTTTIGKISQQLKNEGKSVLIAAGDTFRAAAIEQLKTWGQRSNTDVIAHQEGADPAAVIYDAIQAAKSRKIDVLICDTAGRLHNKKNLMNELEKIHRIISREYEGAKKEVLLVLDATTGQNAILQAKTFDEATNLTGIVLTKLDGTAKGGVVLPLVNQLEVPIKYIGVGEGIDDLQKFNSLEFSKALMGIK